MRYFFIVVLWLLFLICHGLAQEDKILTATSALQGVLISLKKSVEKMGLDNTQLSARNEDIRHQIVELQKQLANVKVRSDVLNRASDKLLQTNPHRDQQISRLEEENLLWDQRIQKDAEGIKQFEPSLDAGAGEYQKLSLRLNTMRNGPGSSGPGLSPQSEAEAFQKEKLKLMKMIYESQQRQESLHQSILEIQGNTPIRSSVNAMAHQQLLKEQIKDLQAQIALYPPEKMEPGVTNQWDDGQLRQLESELNDLEHNYSQLKNLSEQMSQKAKSARMTPAERAEESKLQSSVDDLTHQSQSLRADLDDLRAQMVTLDKRKSRLEIMVQQMPK